MSPLITPHFILSENPSGYGDYRAAVDATGKQLVFERTTAGNPTALWTIPDLGNPVAQQLVTTPSSRPDWSWLGNGIVYNMDSASGTCGVSILDGTATTAVIEAAGTYYPTWAANELLIYVWEAIPNSSVVAPYPNTSQFDPIIGTFTVPTITGPAMWAGMPTVNPVGVSTKNSSPPQFAFAGQMIPSPLNGATYNQDTNYIWIYDAPSGSMAPMEYDCPAGAPPQTPYDKAFQGRAPWWSPDGKWIVFESDRLTGSQYGYAIFLYEVGTKGPAIQLTDPGYNMNHAKFFPDGKTLIVSSYMNPTSVQQPYALATLDISSIVSA